MFSAPLMAQNPPPPGSPSNDPNDPVNQESANKADMRNREWLLGNSRKPIRTAAWGPAEAALPQIKEDFERIQLVNKDLMTAVFAKNLLDFKQIAKATADIGKRAARLKNNLAYPQPIQRAEASHGTNEQPDLRLALARLDDAILRFVTNPIFQADRQVINAEMAMRASDALITVMKFSQNIKRQAEEFSKEKKQR
jgi:hypothetical protein